MKTTILAAAVLLAGFATTAHAQTCSGSSYGIPVKVTFLKGKRVRFCLDSRCSSGAYGGNKNSKLAFGNNRFRFSMTKRSRGYRYRIGGMGLPTLGGAMRCR